MLSMNLRAARSASFVGEPVDEHLDGFPIRGEVEFGLPSLLKDETLDEGEKDAEQPIGVDRGECALGLSALNAFEQEVSLGDAPEHHRVQTSVGEGLCPDLNPHSSATLLSGLGQPLDIGGQRPAKVSTRVGAQRLLD